MAPNADTLHGSKLRRTSAAMSGTIVSTGAPTDNLLVRSTQDPPWRTILSMNGVSLGVIVGYGVMVGSGTFASIALMLALAAISTGALLGFLFGLPRANRIAPPKSVNGGAPSSDGRESEATAQFRPSTNLEQVSDWLTKILIGAGLVQLKQLNDWLADLGTMADRVVPSLSGAGVVAQVTVIFFSISGFISGFLWTRIYYGQIQSRADLRALVAIRDHATDALEASDRAGQQARQAQELASYMLGRGGRPLPRPSQFTATEHLDGRVIASAWPESMRRQLDDFMSAPSIWDSDPGALFGVRHRPEANGRKLEIEIISLVPGDEDSRGLLLRARVSGTDGTDPLKKPVVFLLHPTYDERLQAVSPKLDSAEIRFFAQGWFTFVVVADDGQTVLTYRLDRLPGAPDWFRED